ncbi:hypothetical protein I7I48_02289 [Histoplasma ohiense]|nr:hypothetical protein I7I48_02289 [Histoplasma ohiense (nom. inval.)]
MSFLRDVIMLGLDWGKKRSSVTTACPGLGEDRQYYFHKPCLFKSLYCLKAPGVISCSLQYYTDMYRYISVDTERSLCRYGYNSAKCPETRST